MYTASTSTASSLNDVDITALLTSLRTMDYPDSATKLTQLSEQYTHDARLSLLLAGEHAQAGQMDLAEAAFITALQRDPDYAIARFQLGLLQFTSARPSIASMTWAPLDKLPPQHPLRLFKNGFEFLARDMMQEAAQAIRQGMQKNISNAPLNLDMKKVLITIDKLKIGGITTVDNIATPPPAQTQLAPSDTSIVTTPTETGVSNETTEHFLVSAYRNLH